MAHKVAGSIRELINQSRSTDQFPTPDLISDASVELCLMEAKLGVRAEQIDFLDRENARLRGVLVSLWRMMKTKEFPAEAGILIVKTASSLLVKP